MQVELSEELATLIVHYSYKNNRIRAYAKDTKLSAYVLCQLFSIKKRELSLIMNKTVEIKNIKYNPINTRAAQVNFSKHRTISQTLIRLR